MVKEPEEQTPETLQAEAEALQKKIVVGMPTDTEMRLGGPRTIQKHLNWQKRTRKDVERYQAIRQELRSLPSVEALRQP